MINSNKLKAFLRTGVAQTEPVATHKWRTLPELAKGTNMSIEDVLQAVKEDRDAFVLRFGLFGDIYLAQADNQGNYEGVSPGHGN